MLQGLNNSLPLNNVNKSNQPAQPAAIKFRGEETPEGFEMQNQPEKKKGGLLKWLAVGTVAAGLILFRKKLPIVGKWFEGKTDEAAKAAGAKLGGEVPASTELMNPHVTMVGVTEGQMPKVITGEFPNKPTTGNI
jgi:hypothetical protein